MPTTGERDTDAMKALVTCNAGTPAIHIKVVVVSYYRSCTARVTDCDDGGQIADADMTSKHRRRDYSAEYGGCDIIQKNGNHCDYDEQ